MNSPHIKPLHKAFSLIELLVVITIVAVLLAVLLPTLAHARAQAKIVLCQSNLRQMYLGDIAYRNDHRDWMPTLFYQRMAITPGYANPSITPRFREYWGDTVSWCPTIEHMEPGSINGAPGWETRNTWADNGYQRPMYSYFIAAIWLYDYADNPANPYYVRYREKVILGEGTNWPASARPTVDVADSLPVIMDILYSYSSIANPQFSTSAHAVNNGPCIRPNGGWIPPIGSNMVWRDGQVQFKKWEPSVQPISDEFVYIPTGQVAAEEGFSQTLSGNNGIIYARRGKY